MDVEHALSLPTLPRCPLVYRTLALPHVPVPALLSNAAALFLASHLVIVHVENCLVHVRLVQVELRELVPLLHGALKGGHVDRRDPCRQDGGTYVTGSPMAEVLRANLEKIEASNVLGELGLEPKRYMLLSAHREENIDTEANFTSLFTAINALAEKYDMPILYSCHPRSRKRLEATGFKLDPRVRMHEPMGFHDYNCLQMNAFAVVSDSGTLPEESSFFASIGKPFPAVCIRTSIERPEALDKACFTLAGISEKGLLQAVHTAVALDAEGSYPEAPVHDYADETVSTKVVKIIQSYTGVVDKMVWRKQG